MRSAAPNRVSWCLGALLFALGGAWAFAQDETVHEQEDAPPQEEHGEERPQAHYRVDRSFFKALWRDEKFIVMRPFRVPRRTLYKAGGVVALSYGMMYDHDGSYQSVDEHINQGFDSFRTDAGRRWADDISFLGSHESALLLGVSYWTARWSGNERFADASRLAFQVLVDTAVVGETLKIASNRPRPSFGRDENSAAGFGETFEDTHRSFVSGHAIGAFTVATVFAMEYGRDHVWAPYAAYGAAGLVGLSRMYLEQHWASDVLVGAVLGTAITRSLLKNVYAVSSESAPPRRARMLVSPVFVPGKEGYIGVRIQFSVRSPSLETDGRTFD